jgi:hypothetical protein
VLKAVKAGVNGRLRLYPDPTAQPLREKLAKFHKCGAENIIVGNGSDELLALATRAFVEPGDGRGAPGCLRSRRRKISKSTDPVLCSQLFALPILASIPRREGEPGCR